MPSNTTLTTFSLLVICVAAAGHSQTFVPTIADRPELLRTPGTPQIDFKTIVEKNLSLFNTQIQTRFNTGKETEADNVYAAQVAKRLELKDQPADIQDAGAFEAGCNVLEGLVNAWRPTRWAAYRTACFWGTTSHRYAKDCYS